MNTIFWRLVAFIVTQPMVRRWIIKRAMRTPYRHIPSADGEGTYMGRWWLANPYDADYKRRWSFLPAIRLHSIMRADQDRHMHSHPYQARTIILQGWYFEETPGPKGNGRRSHCREVGYTGRLTPGTYHRISCVPWDGVWTLFFTWSAAPDGWGFLVDGKHVPHSEYLANRKST